MAGRHYLHPGPDVRCACLDLQAFHGLWCGLPLKSPAIERPVNAAGRAASLVLSHTMAQHIVETVTDTECARKAMAARLTEGLVGCIHA